MISKNLSLISSILSIFVFITGIYSLPEILNNGSSKSELGLFNSDINRGVSIGILIISQVVYYVSLFTIVSKAKTYLFPGETYLYIRGSRKHKALFYFVITSILGIGLSTLFLEGIWGKIPYLIATGQLLTLILFSLLSIIGNIFTVWNAMELEYKR